MITILCPSRGRPDKFKRLLKSLYDTAYGEKFNIFLYLDEDDETKHLYPGNVPHSYTIIGKPKYLVQAYEDLFSRCNSDIVMLGADDLLFKDKGWVEKVNKARTENGLFLVSFDDGGREGKKKENGHPFMGREFVLECGFPEDLTHSLIDKWFVKIAKSLNIFYYIENLGIEHLHPKYNKGEWDETHKRKALPKTDLAIFRSLPKKKVISKIRGQLIEHTSDSK